MNDQDYPIAVVGNGQITTSTGGVRECTPNMARNVVQLAEWALGPVQPARSIWIMPGSEFAEMAADPAFWLNDDPKWNVFTTGTQGGPPNVACVRRNGKDVKWADRREVNIYGALSERWWVDESITDHAALLGIIRAYEQQMGPTRLTPGNTAIKLLEDIHMHCGSAAWLDALSEEMMHKISWPVPYAPAHANRWVGDGKFVLVFDKKSAHIASAAGLVGRGDPSYEVNDTSDELLYSPMFYPREWVNWIEKERPALWCVSARPPLNMSPKDREKLPSPFNNQDELPDHGWYYGPQVKLALEMGYQVALHEVYVWKQAHDTLDKWAARIWQARKALEGTPAEMMVKSSYTHALGIMSRKLKPGDRQAWYNRPDWQGLVAARDYQRQIKKIIQLQACGVEYLAISHDSIAIVSNHRDPSMAVPIGWMQRPKQQLGIYRHECTYEGERAHKLIGMARDGIGAAGLYNLMNKWDEEDGEDD